jgi:hypothetical protein
MRNFLFVCALTLLVNSSSRAQQQPKPDPKSTTPDPTAKPKRKVLDADLSGFDISDPKSEKKVTTMLPSTGPSPVTTKATSSSSPTKTKPNYSTSN